MPIDPHLKVRAQFPTQPWLWAYLDWPPIGQPPPAPENRSQGDFGPFLMLPPGGGCPPADPQLLARFEEDPDKRPYIWDLEED